MRKTTSKEIAEFLFKEKERLPKIGFYLYKTGDEYEWGYEIGVIDFADSLTVIGNYAGGGAPFIYDITDDTDASGLEECVDDWLKHQAAYSPNGVNFVYADKLEYGDEYSTENLEDGSPIGNG